MQSSAIRTMAIVAGAAVVGGAHGQLTTWRGGGDDWFKPGKWTNGLPDNNNICVVSTGHPTIGAGKNADSWKLWVGVRKNQAAECTMKGAKHWTVELQLGTAKDSTGRYNLNAGVLESVAEEIGIDGKGLIVQTGGTNGKAAVPITFIELGTRATGDGEYRLEGGDVHADTVYNGRKNVGTIKQTGGKFVVHGILGLTLGEREDSKGAYSIANGQLVVHHKVNVGHGGKGTLTQTGGSVVILADLNLGRSPLTGQGEVSVT